MDLMAARRRLMQMQERWDYIALPDENGYCYLENYLKYPVINKGDIVTIKWSGAASGYDNTWAYIWSAWDLRLINAETGTDITSLRQVGAPQQGMYRLIVTTNNSSTANARGISIGRYNTTKEINQSFKGDYIKIRIN
jgi:hypothetical protein